MKFGHLADCHVGGWREPKLRELNTKAFCYAIDALLVTKVEFVIIAGDLFNTAFPAVDSLTIATRKLKQLKDANIPVYAISGSHDFSPSGKTMLDVLEEAGLLVNVAQGSVDERGKLHLKFTIDKKTGVKITGLVGRKGGLDIEYYHMLCREELEQEPGAKIFVFHCALAELKPKHLQEMEAMAISLFPKGFDYYAGGHVHVVDHQNLQHYPNIVYPGPVFPNNFAELEKLEHGTFVIVEDWKPKHIAIPLNPVVSLAIDCEHKTPAQATELLNKAIAEKNIKDALVLLRLSGKLNQGRASDIAWNEIIASIHNKGAYFVMKNTNALTSQEYEEVKVSQQSVEDIETALLQEHAGKIMLASKETDAKLAQSLLQSMALEKEEGEKIADFEKRLKIAVDRILSID